MDELENNHDDDAYRTLILLMKELREMQGKLILCKWLVKEILGE